ncbi:DUF6953 family protein [Burkholderia cenocepacia]|uniref:DUF6953 family protein n=1 Tax=Burkholderia cenocepacia TaxID=95486 RepID=UPI000D0C515E|nr:hypothetical protein [Burkholderia cenocepacia]SOT45108.1 conserved hypothetical protein [Burkholderia cenocepacia]
MKATASDAAAWMKNFIESNAILYQEVAVGEIIRQFGDHLSTVNSNGNLAISAAVLKVFNTITGNDVVWVRSERMWRKRQPYDSPGRQQP